MKQFFFRIFLAIWIILPITGAVTMLTGKLFQHTGWLAQPTDFEANMVAKVVEDINSIQSNDPAEITQQILARHVLDMEQMMQIYVVSPSGKDILHRKLPTYVEQRLSGRLSNKLFDGGYRIVSMTTTHQGYKVIGHKMPYPLVRMVFQPKIRFVLWSVMILVSAFVTWRLATFIVAPLRMLREASVQVVSGNLDIRVANAVANRSDDIALLAQDFDTMTHKIESLLSAQQRLMRDVSHELRSPLARLQAMISIANQQQNKQPIDLARVQFELEKLDDLIGDILQYSRIDTMQGITKQRTDLVDLISVICEGAEIEAACDIQRIKINAPRQLITLVDAKLLGSAIENILRNALKFSPLDAFINITLSHRSDTISIVIEDSGSGAPEDCLEHLFSPFYQVDNGVKPSQSGSGVGLSIALRAVELHQGKIFAENLKPHGLKVSILLPHST